MKRVELYWEVRFFPLSRAAELGAFQVREHLRDCFEAWGLPQQLRVDNGRPWANSSDVPSSLVLWLVGLGIRVRLNRPYHCTENGIVERDHGVLAQWVEPHRVSTLTAFQHQLDWAIHMQRERYPARQGQARMTAYPTLRHNPRPYIRTNEHRLWQMTHVEAFLARFLWMRRVDKVGRISLFNHSFSVGRPATATTVFVHFDPQHHCWQIESEQGQLLKSHPNTLVTQERIHALAVTGRPNSPSLQAI